MNIKLNIFFFHVQTIIRRKWNMIHGLFLRLCKWCTKPNTCRMRQWHISKKKKNYNTKAQVRDNINLFYQPFLMNVN